MCPGRRFRMQSKELDEIASQATGKPAICWRGNIAAASGRLRKGLVERHFRRGDAEMRQKRWIQGNGLSLQGSGLHGIVWPVWV